MPKRSTASIRRSPASQAGPIVLLAAPYQFRPSERIVQPRIEGHGLLWCREGRGTVEVDRSLHIMEPGQFLVLPWGRRQIYQADETQPYHLGSVHWIPSHDFDHEVIFEIAHSKESRVAGLPWRKDASIDNWTRGVRAGNIDDAPGLYHLAEFIVARFTDVTGNLRDSHSPDEARQLGVALVAEVQRVLEGRLGAGVSPAFARMAQFIRDHLADPLTLEELASFASVSRATLVRLFRKQVRQSPVQYVTRVRVERARLLLRRTRMPISQVAAAVGIPDPYYFSRLFREHTSVSPRQFRQRAPNPGV